MVNIYTKFVLLRIIPYKMLSSKKWILEVIVLTSDVDFLNVLVTQNIFTYSDELGHKFNTLQA